MEPSSDAVQKALETLRVKQKETQKAFHTLVRLSKITWEAEVLLAFESFLLTPFPKSLLRKGIEPPSLPNETLLKQSNLEKDPLDMETGLRAIQKGLVPFSVDFPTLETERTTFRIELCQRIFAVLRANTIAKDLESIPEGKEKEGKEEKEEKEGKEGKEEKEGKEGKGTGAKEEAIRSRLDRQPGLLVHNFKSLNTTTNTYYITYSKYKVLQLNTIVHCKKSQEFFFPYWRIPNSWNTDTLPFATQCPTCQKQNRLLFESPVKTTVQSVSCPSGHYKWIASTNKVKKPVNPYKGMIQKAEATILRLQEQIEGWRRFL